MNRPRGMDEWRGTHYRHLGYKYRHGRYFMALHYRHWRCRIPTWTLQKNPALPTWTLQNTDMDVIFWGVTR